MQTRSRWTSSETYRNWLFRRIDLGLCTVGRRCEPRQDAGRFDQSVEGESLLDEVLLALRACDADLQFSQSDACHRVPVVCDKPGPAGRTAVTKLPFMQFAVAVKELGNRPTERSGCTRIQIRVANVLSQLRQSQIVPRAMDWNRVSFDVALALNRPRLFHNSMSPGAADYSAEGSHY